MNISALTDIGLVRNINEDMFFQSDDVDFPLFIVADGMGGHNAGETASKMAVDIIKQYFLQHKKYLKDENRLTSIIENSIIEANSEIYKSSKELETLSGMGTTITLAYILKEYLYIGHVGDSRAYIISGEGISQITEDHSLVNELVKNGSITIEESKTHPQRNMITRAVGTSNEIEVDVIKRHYNSNDILLICSDGLSNMVSDEEILKIFNKIPIIKEACKELINKAKDNGGKDNITIIAVKLVR